MPQYKVSCSMKSPDYKKRIAVFAHDKHPDLAKQKLLKQYKGYIMEQIKIERVD